MNVTHRKGKDITEDIRVRLHFPASITDEERDWIVRMLHILIPHEAQQLLEKVLIDR